MRISVLMSGAAGLALVFAASAAAAGSMAYGGGAGQCGPNGCGTPGPVGYGPGQITNEDYPPNAAPGQCFTKVLVPEITETVTEHVLVTPEKTDIKVTPGGYRVEEKSVLVKEESVEYFSIPATYKTVTEVVVVKPAYTRTETIPATYETVTEQVKVKDGYTAWRPGATVAGYAPGSANTYNGGGSGSYGKPAESYGKPAGTYGSGVIEHNPQYNGLTTKVLPTGEVLCLVEVPPEYKTITKTVLKTPARTVEIPVPAETRTISRQIVDQPAHVEKKIIPAVYETVKIKVQGPDSTQAIVTPAVYNDYSKIKVVTPSRFEWKQVDCRTDVVHAGGYGEPTRPTYTPPVKTYGETPKPPVKTYTPPVKTYGEAPKPKPPVYKPAPKKPTYGETPPPPPSYGAVPPKHGKQCRTTTTCEDEPTPATYAPAPKPAPTSTKSEVTETTAPAMAPAAPAMASNTGGDRAVANLQAALATRGYYAGPQNGLFTQDTMHAMVKYQEDNHLAAGRYTGETANSLGIASR